MIEIRNLRVLYGNTVAIHPLDLTLSEGITGLFGPNGAGKTTLLRVLAGLLRPISGSATWAGREIKSSDEEIRRSIGYVSHTSGLYARLTVAENLRLFGRLYGCDDARAIEVLELVGMTKCAGARVSDLSAGLKRRAAVARALLHEPALLLLDEPYANLDDEACELVSNAIVRWRGPGRAAVIATHGAKRVKSFADSAVILQRGRVLSHRQRSTDEGAEAR